MSAASLPCIVCRRALDDALTGLDVNQPADATIFHSHGNYGSTVFDPMSERERLDINICDECLIAAARDGIVNHTLTEGTPPRLTTTPWMPAAPPVTGTRLDPQPGLAARRALGDAIRDRVADLGGREQLNRPAGHPLEDTLWLMEVSSLTATITDEALAAVDEWLNWPAGMSATIVDAALPPTLHHPEVQS